jgi:hypothetical protein
MYVCQQYKYRCNDILIFVFNWDDIGRREMKKSHRLEKYFADTEWSHLVQGTVWTRTGIIGFKE